MRRPEFVMLLGCMAMAWPLAAQAQQVAMPVVGFLDPGSPETSQGLVVDFRQGLADAGYVEGKTVAIEYRWANAEVRNLPELAKDLADRRVNVIVASGAVGSALAAKAATSTIPIVIAGGADPVRYGLAASLHRPGGNVTGITVIHGELAAKRLDLVRDLVPGATAIAYLTNPVRSPVATEYANELFGSARAGGRRLIILECLSAKDLEPAFTTLVQSGAEALVVEAFVTAFNNRGRIVALAAQYKIPTIYPQPQYVHDGGLMSYSAATTLRDVAIQYVAPILKGANPANLPIQQPTKFMLVINLKTAKALGLEVPLTLQAIADKVIE
jgi:putative ABC transport system substrate-binding protein